MVEPQEILAANPARISLDITPHHLKFEFGCLPLVLLLALS